MPLTPVPFAPFEPDKALLGGQHSPDARGVIPSASGYIPLPQLVDEPQLPALAGQFRGAASFYDTSGNPVILAGTDAALYWMHGHEWQEVGNGYTATWWDFARYGDGIIAVNGADKPQYATIGTANVTNFEAIESAPVGSSVEVVREFVVIGGVGKTKIQWCAIGNPLDWPVPGTNDAQYKQSDEQDFPDTGAAVEVCGALSGLDMLVFTERAIHRGRYVGSPYIFQFEILDKGRGALAPRSVVTGNSAIYFLSEEGFFATDGSSLTNIGLERVNRWFRELSDDTRRHDVRGERDPFSGVIFWTFAGNSAPADAHDHIVIYHPDLDRWSYGKAKTSGIFSGLSAGRTLEDLDAIAPIDLLPFSLDARIWKGGVPGLAAFDRSGKMQWFYGTPSEAVIDTAETGGKRMMVHGIRPLVDGAKAGASVFYRDFQHQKHEEAMCSAQSRFDGVCYTHVSARYARARVAIPAGSEWAHAIGCEVLTEEEGSL